MECGKPLIQRMRLMESKKQSVIGALWRQQIWIFALMILAGIGLGAVKISDSQTADAFSENGVEVIGEITDMTDYSGSKNKKTFIISYTFATTADPYNSGQQLVSQTFYEAQTKGGPIAIWYMPTDPTQNVVDLGKLSRGFGLTFMAALGLILAGVISGGFAVKRAITQVRG